MRQAQTTSETFSACAIKKKQVDLHLWCVVRIFAIPIHICLSIIRNRNKIYCACTYRIKHVCIEIHVYIYIFICKYILFTYVLWPREYWGINLVTMIHLGIMAMNIHYQPVAAWYKYCVSTTKNWHGNAKKEPGPRCCYLIAPGHSQVSLLVVTGAVSVFNGGNGVLCCLFLIMYM
jgi:hypothetical protein